jgi:hypothetical protein
MHSQFAPSLQRFQLVSEGGMEHEVHGLHALTDSLPPFTDSVHALHRPATLQVDHVTYEYNRQQQVYEDHTLKYMSTAAPAVGFAQPAVSFSQQSRHSPHIGAGRAVTEEEDSFWTDASFFQEFHERPVVDQSPFWDCFLSKLT